MPISDGCGFIQETTAIIFLASTYYQYGDGIALNTTTAHAVASAVVFVDYPIGYASCEMGNPLLV